ncbi:MAG: tRNA (adenosine(37)-N6)-threonylcarbamoyltransferase complex ATPase subunit type 1 TsaE [Patescibacteria group bacterium]|nr:tRNA (adenosine(37)-N6)-threonylcarbamoyltransferase complex ATPase subunit type 1 TsaE [Patescibacteria group bacterium]
MIKKEITTNSPEETKKIGFLMGKKALEKEKFFLSLSGDLGGGKTTFTQGFAKGVGVEEDITSPTFLVFKKYKTKNNRHFYHLDAYRIEDKDLSILGFQEIIENEKNIVVVEWGENIKKSLPEETVKIHFEFKDKKARKLIIQGDSDIIKN